MTKLLVVLLFLSQSLFAQSYMNADDQDFYNLSTDLVSIKASVDSLSKEVNTSLKEKGYLTGKVLDQINVFAQKSLVIGENAYEYIDKYKYLVLKNPRRLQSLKLTEVTNFVKALAVTVTMFDVVNYAYFSFQGHRKMRIILNEENSSYQRAENSYKRAIKAIYSHRNRNYISRALKIYKAFYLDHIERFEDQNLTKAKILVENSYIYHQYKNGNNLKQFFIVIGTKLKIGAKTQLDFISFIGNSIVYFGSKVFGNYMGRFQERNGKLFKSSKFIRKVKRTLKPLDVLLEKTPFRLTDNFIPGYWGHAAIYIGTKKDLKKLGIWEHELVQKYKNEIESGRSIVEALRDNVQINSINDFTDIDDFAIIRLKEKLSDEEKAQHILRALSQVGKLYDFAFDVDTALTIVCSELHYRTFVNIDFNTSLILWRSTISVDQVAEQGYSNMPFEPKLLYIDGKKVNKRDMQAVYDQKLDESQYKYLDSREDEIFIGPLEDINNSIELGFVNEFA